MSLIPVVEIPLTPEESNLQADANLAVLNHRGRLGQARADFERLGAENHGIAPRALMNKMRAAADKIVAEVTPHSACRNRCNYCCHIPVVINKIEADILAKVSGRKVSKVDQNKAMTNGNLYHKQPCPFLSSKGACSVYEDRPMACRLNFNLSDSPYFCNTEIPPEDSHVAYLNLEKLNFLFVGSFFDTVYADIRDFFPNSDSLR
jgi:Fe-S-cluster containining protein